jgi:hypothetical protein
MGMFDWVAAGLLNKDIETPGFTGTYGTTMGDAVSGFYGSRHAHIFGPDVKLVCDIEDMIVTHGIEGGLKLPFLAALLAGVGGNVTFCYGSNTTATYVGPKMEIRRAENITKTSDNIIARVGATDVVDTATVVAVTVLSALICATTAALEMAIHFVYPKYGSTAASDHETIESYGKLPEILKLCVIMVTTRLMAILKMLEDEGTWANLAEHYAEMAEHCLTVAGEAIATYIIVPIYLAYMARQARLAAERAAAAAAAALEEAEGAVAAVV